MRARTAVIAAVIWLSVLFCLPGLAAAQSPAEPAPEASAEPATPRAAPAATEEAQAPPTAPADRPATAPANGPATKVDLFPSSVFGPDAPALGMRGGSTGGSSGGSSGGAIGGEQRPGFSLGDDADWRVQAAQVGAMVAGFAVLAALCGGARCLLPDKLSLPGPFAPRPQVVPQLRPPLRGAPRADY